jgi:hypothetical protein
MGTIRRGRASVIMKMKEKMEGDTIGIVCGANIVHRYTQMAVT